jgi:hypothetical protein
MDLCVFDIYKFKKKVQLDQEAMRVLTILIF